MNITTNKIRFELNVDKITSNYDIFMINYLNNKFDKNILDIDVETKFKAKSVVYLYGNNAFMMYHKKQVTRDILYEVLNANSKNGMIDVRQLTSFKEDYQKRILFRLLMNGLHNNYSEDVMCNNLTGKLYYFQKEWRYTRGDYDRIWCLNISLDEYNIITESVETFISAKDTDYTKKEGAIKLVFDKKTCQLKKYTKSDKNISFFIKKSTGWNSSVKALEFSNNKEYSLSKYGILYIFKKNMEEAYSNMVNFDWMTYDANDITLKDKEVSSLENRDYSKRINIKKLNIINTLEDDTLLASLQQELRQLHIQFSVSVNIDQQKYNIVLLREKSAYNNTEEDPYQQSKKYYVQHMTDRIQNRESLKVIITELVIKDDISNNHINLVNWSQYDFNKDISIALISKGYNDEYNKYYIITVKPDGSIKKRSFINPETIDDIFIMKAFLKNINIGKDKIDSDIEFILWHDLDDIYAFKKSNEILLPEIDKLSNKLSIINHKRKVLSSELINLIESSDCTFQYKKQIDEIALSKDYFMLSDLQKEISGRTEEGRKLRKHLENNGIGIRVSKSKDSGNGLTNFTGVKYFIESNNDSICKFYVGLKNGISKYCMDKSVIIRSAVRLNNTPIDINFIQKILLLPQVSFVKNGQYSVHPFIYKYLNEYKEVE